MSFETFLAYEGPVGYAVISAATAADHAIVAAVAGKRIVVLSYDLIVNGTVTVTWKSASTAISGAYSLDNTSKPGIVRSHSPVGHMRTASGEALNLTLGQAIQVSGSIVYQIVDATKFG